MPVAPSHATSIESGLPHATFAALAFAVTAPAVTAPALTAPVLTAPVLNAPARAACANFTAYSTRSRDSIASLRVATTLSVCAPSPCLVVSSANTSPFAQRPTRTPSTKNSNSFAGSSPGAPRGLSSIWPFIVAPRAAPSTVTPPPPFDDAFAHGRHSGSPITSN